MKKITIISIAIILLLSSCCKDKADRTDYLSPLQKDITNMYQTGDTFRMVRNGTDTIEAFVTASSIGQTVDGSFCNKHWSDNGWVFFKTPNAPVIDGVKWGMSGNIQAKADRETDFVSIIFEGNSFEGNLQYISSKRIGDKVYTDVYYLLDDQYNVDTMYISLEFVFLAVSTKHDGHFIIE